MSWYCIHNKSSDNPYEINCDIDINNNCENCPYQYSQEDYEGDLIDFQYELYND